MDMLRKVSVALVLLGLTGIASATETRNDQDSAQAMSSASSGSYSTEATDRGGKLADDGSSTLSALLDWLNGLRD